MRSRVFLNDKTALGRFLFFTFRRLLQSRRRFMCFGKVALFTIALERIGRGFLRGERLRQGLLHGEDRRKKISELSESFQRFGRRKEKRVRLFRTHRFLELVPGYG